MAAIAGSASPAVGQEATTCFGLEPTIVGDERSNRLVGTLGDDVIMGFEGNDEILGRAGDDVICGGEGADSALSAAWSQEPAVGSRAQATATNRSGRQAA